MFRFRPYGFLTLILILLLVACVPNRVKVGCEIPQSAAATDAVAINLFVDGTPSMQGFVSDPNSQYVQTLDKLESVLLNQPPVTFEGKTRTFSREMQYFRLGEDPKTGQPFAPIDRKQYRQAQISSFYGGSGFPSLQVSRIDAAIQPPTKDNELTVIVTDLYQADEDAVAIVNRIKQYLTATNQTGSVGIVGIKSQFNGTVYTEAQVGSGKFSWDDLHPFYLLLIGQLDDVHFYVDRFVKTLEVKEMEATIFSPYRLYGTIATLPRTLEKDLSPTQRKQIDVPTTRLQHGNLAVSLEGEAVQPIVIKGKQPELSATVNLKPIRHVLETKPDALSATPTLHTYDAKSRKFVVKSNHPAQAGVIVKDLRLEGEELRFTTQILPDKIRPAGIYFYTIDAKFNSTGDSFLEQGWWSAWNSEPTSQEGSKTHELEDFLQDLRDMTAALMRQNPPLVGRFCYLVQKN
jgi:hypothetical protein